MLSPGVTFLLVLNFLFIGLLPAIFFRKDGRYNLMWLVTALPYILTPLFLLSSYGWGGEGNANPFLRLIHFPLRSPELQTWMELETVLLSTLSVIMIALTIGTHQKPLALWHQDNDAPQHLVDYGPYSQIRHPFYASFLLALLGAFFFYPTLGTLFTLAYGYISMTTTARREEQRFLASPLGDQYREYMKRAGRFAPRFWKG